MAAVSLNNKRGNAMIKVYLAGGMRSNWRERVMKEVPNLLYFNPKTKEYSDERMIWSPDMYGTWDLVHVRICDIIFGYMEKTNPSGIGMAAELGVGYGLGKTNILCLEQNRIIPPRYSDFMKKVAHITFDDFKESVNYLKTFQTVPG